MIDQIIHMDRGLAIMLAVSFSFWVVLVLLVVLVVRVADKGPKHLRKSVKGKENESLQNKPN